VRVIAHLCAFYTSTLTVIEKYQVYRIADTTCGSDCLKIQEMRKTNLYFLMIQHYSFGIGIKLPHDTTLFFGIAIKLSPSCPTLPLVTSVHQIGLSRD